MPNDISGLPPVPARPGRTDGQPIDPGRRLDPDPVSGQPDAVARDRVTLTDGGRRLQEAQRQAEAGEAVDQAKVAALRAAIAQGEYRIDSRVIADKLIGLEQALFGNG